jgi:hypothetical protein
MLLLHAAAAQAGLQPTRWPPALAPSEGQEFPMFSDCSQAPRNAQRFRPLSWDAPLTWGPLNLRSRAPIFDNRLSYTAGRVAPLRRRAIELTLTFSHVNVWAQMPGYFFDGEWSRADLKAAVGVGRTTEVSAEFGLLRRSGGYMDGLIEGFHGLFGITQARRQNYPRNRLHVATLRGSEHVWLDDSDAGMGLVSPVLAVKKGLLQPADDASPRQAAHWPTVSADLAVKLPLGHTAAQYASPRMTALADIALQQPIAKWLQVYVTYGLMLSPGTGRMYGMPLSEVQKLLMLAMVFRVATHWTISAQYLNQDGSVEGPNFSPLEQTTHEFGLGFKWAPGADDRWIVQAGLIENTVHDANTPDFGFTLGLQAKL